MSGYRVQGAPTAIESNTRGAGMVEGDQLGDTFPGILSTLQEDPGASRVSNLYYKEAVGSFRQPSFQRAFGSYNLTMNITRFGDSGSVEINPDIFWKGPMLLRTSFLIPYTYHGPDVYIPHNIPAATTSFGPLTGWNTTSPYNAYGNYNYAHPGLADAGVGVAGGNAAFFMQKASTINVRPKLFYSWGAAYANIHSVRMNMGGALNYVLDRFANFVGIMASCPSLKQRAALMRAAGNGTLIPDYINEHKYGLNHETCELGNLPLFSADGGVMSANSVSLSAQSYGGGGGVYQNGASNIPGPVVEHWVAAIKTPQTNFGCGVYGDHRRPVDTRLFSSNFVFEVFTANKMDTFVDSGTGWQPVCGRLPISTNEWGAAICSGLFIPQGSANALWLNTDGLFPSMCYRQLQLPQITSGGNTLWSSFSVSPGVTSGNSTYYFGLYNSDVTPYTAIGGQADSTVDQYRATQYTAWPIIAQSAGYKDCYGASLPPSQPTNYLNSNNLPTPMYTTIINTLRLANDQLGAKEVLETRPDLAIYYPFQHMTTQVFFINQLTQNSTGITPFTNANQGWPITNFTNTSLGGQGFGGLSELNCRTYLQAPTSYNIPLSTQIQIPVNPLTCMYMMVMREKDRMALGYSSPNTYSPVLYWNALELSNMLLTYSAQTLQRYDGFDEYHLQQLHERVEPLIVPFRGGVVVRSDLPLQDPSVIQENTGYPGAWYNSYIYEFCMVDQLPFHNEAFFQQTPSFRGEMLNFSFNIQPSLRRYKPGDFDFRSNTGIDATQTSSMAKYTFAWYNYLERLAYYCPGIPGSCVSESAASGVNWNLNNDNLSVVVVYAQNALWQLSPRFTKMIFARGA